MTNKRYLLIPLGLSFDSLIDAAIVATRRENSGNTVHDTVEGVEVAHQTLLNAIRSVKKPKQQTTAPIQQGFFDGYYKLLPLLIENHYDEDDEEDELPLKSINFVKTLFPRLAQAAQKVYDAWDEEDNDTYAGGGICHLIADEFVSILYEHGVECTSVSSSHEQHVYVALKVIEGVYTLDLHYSIYETGGGFSWKKIPNVKFDGNDISIFRVSRDPKDFKDQLD